MQRWVLEWILEGVLAVDSMEISQAGGEEGSGFCDDVF